MTFQSDLETRKVVSVQLKLFLNLSFMLLPKQERLKIICSCTLCLEQSLLCNSWILHSLKRGWEWHLWY